MVQCCQFAESHKNLNTNQSFLWCVCRFYLLKTQQVKSTASPMDTLIVGPSGAGYTYLDQYPDAETRRAFAEWTAANVQRSGLVNMVNQIQLTMFNASVEAEQLELASPPEAIFVDVEKVLTIKGNAQRLIGANGQPTDSVVSSRRHCLSKTFGDVTPVELVKCRLQVHSTLHQVAGRR